MRCSVDLRKRVLAYVNNGGSKAEAARRFGVSVPSVFNWLKADDPLKYQKPGPRGLGAKTQRLDWKKLAAHARTHPDALLKERAVHFGVGVNTVWYALRQMKLSRKKNLGLQGVVTTSKAPQKIYQDNRPAGARRS